MKKKIFDIISALLVISILAFIFIQLSPGDPAENYLRASHLPITDELLKQKILLFNSICQLFTCFFPIYFRNWLCGESTYHGLYGCI